MKYQTHDIINTSEESEDKFKGMADFEKALQTADWRRHIIAIYSEVRRQSQDDPRAAHDYWGREHREPCRLHIPTGTDGIVPFDRIGLIHVPDIGELDVWYLGSYGGGIFVPIKDNLAGKPDGIYGGGRYLIDTIKGADLGPEMLGQTLVLDFNFAYNPSCAYNPVWVCPLATPGNVVSIDIPVGERYSNDHL